MKMPKINSKAWQALVVKACATWPDRRTPEMKLALEQADRLWRAESVKEGVSQ